MNPGKQWRSILAVAAALMMAALACGPNVGGPKPPASPIPVSTEAAGQLEGVWGTAVANAQNGKLTVVMTEQQLTSYAAIKLASDPQTPIQDPQIYLRDGKMQLFGKAKTQGMTLPVALTASVVPTADGAVSVTIVNASIGPFPIPSSLSDSLSTNLNDLIDQQVTSGGSPLKVTDITIADGKMTIIGTLAR